MHLLWKFPIYFIIFNKIGQILKVSPTVKEEKDRGILTTYLVLYVMLLIVAIIM